MIQAAVAGVTALAMLAPATPSDAGPVSPPSARATVQVVYANGSGCPIGSYNQADFTADYTQLLFAFDYRFIAQAGGSVIPTAFRKTCRLVMDITPPDGYTYAITAVQYQGYGYLKTGAFGSWQAVHHFDGDPAPVPVRHPFTGPMEDIWYVVEETDPDALVWAPCDARPSLVISARLDVSVGTSDPTITNVLAMDGVDVQPNRYDVSWRPC